MGVCYLISLIFLGLEINRKEDKKNRMITDQLFCIIESEHTETGEGIFLQDEEESKRRWKRTACGL